MANVTFQEYWDNGLQGPRSEVDFNTLQNYQSNPYQWFNTKRPVFKKFTTDSGFANDATITFAEFFWTDFVDPIFDPNPRILNFPVTYTREDLGTKSFDYTFNDEGNIDNIFTAETWSVEPVVYKDAYEFLIDVLHQISADNLTLTVGFSLFASDQFSFEQESDILINENETKTKIPNIITELNLDFVSLESTIQNEQEKAINMLSALYNRNKIKINSAKYSENVDTSVETIFSANNSSFFSGDRGFLGSAEFILTPTSSLDSAKNISSLDVTFIRELVADIGEENFNTTEPELSTKINLPENSSNLDKDSLPFFYSNVNGLVDLSYSGSITVVAGPNAGVPSFTDPFTEESELVSVSGTQSLTLKDANDPFFDVSAVKYDPTVFFSLPGFSNLQVIKKSKKTQEFALDLKPSNLFDFLPTSYLFLNGSKSPSFGRSFVPLQPVDGRFSSSSRASPATSGNFFFARHIKNIIYPDGPNLSIDGFSSATGSSAGVGISADLSASSSVSISIEKKDTANANIQFYTSNSTKPNKYTIPFDAYEVIAFPNLQASFSVTETFSNGDETFTSSFSETSSSTTLKNDFDTNIDFDIDIICDRPYLNEFDPSNLV